MFASGKTAAVASAANYIEEVFSTYLYTGNGSTQTITNGIDLSGKGGLVWGKKRGAAGDHYFTDTVRGNTAVLKSNSTAAQVTNETVISGFNSNGFGITDIFSDSGVTYASWTFRKQPKFFDVVTYTGNDATSRTLSHSINGTVGCVMVKKTSSAGNWIVWHRTFPTAGDYIILNSTAAKQNDVDNGISTTNTTFTVGFGLNVSGENYVAYLFAHDAGGFGLTGTDNVISCGSYTGNGSATGPVIDLGYEPQFLIIKRASNAADWVMHDNMRGISETSYAQLRPNLSDAEYTGTPAQLSLTSTGFQIRTSGTNYNASGNTYIYIAIRRGPMKVPTDGTSVFTPAVFTDVDKLTTAGFPVDAAIEFQNITTSNLQYFSNRLTAPKALNSRSTAAETTEVQVWASNTQVQLSDQGNSYKRLYLMMRRAPSFMDVVCYTGTGSARTVSHNLGVAPELMIVRSRSAAANWEVYVAALGPTKYLRLDLTSAAGTYSDFWNDTAPTASVFTVATDADVNGSGRTQIAYLFATCAGVSKVGSYTGTATTLQVDCGFTGGSRFVLIKRTDSTGDWYVWDSARGIVAGNDPYLLLNSTAAETTTTDYIDTYSAGFEISSTAPAAINASGGTFIFLAIA